MIEYDKIIKQYINDDIVEPIRFTKTSYDLGSVQYLPHCTVVRQNRDTTKVRTAFDTSAHVDSEPSLNDVLYPGPCMLPLLHNILIRFRIGKIDIVADVQQAFLQIEIDENHWDFLRFIWFDNVLSNNPSYVLLRFARVVSSVTCSPFLLNGTLKVHLEKFIPIESYPKFIQQLLLNLYVDDLSNSFNNVEDSFKFYEVSKKCLAEASFKLQKWATNIDELAKLIKLNESDTTEMHNADDETYVTDSLGISDTYRKVMGVNWNTTDDKFGFEFSDIINIASKLNVTERNILKVNAMFFDPLGLIFPVLLQPKLLFRNIGTGTLK